MRGDVKQLGLTLVKDVSSFCIALAADPVVNTSKPRHVFSLSYLATILRRRDAALSLNVLLSWCAAGANEHEDLPELEVEAARLLFENRMLLTFLVAVSSNALIFKRNRIIVADVLTAVRD